MAVRTYITKGCIEQASHNVAVAVSQVLSYVAQQQRQGHQRQEVLQVHQDGVVRQSGAGLPPGSTVITWSRCLEAGLPTDPSFLGSRPKVQLFLSLQKNGD